MLVDYTSNRDFSVDPATAPAAGDLGWRIVVHRREDSPTNAPLLVIANEVSGTVTFYRLH